MKNATKYADALRSLNRQLAREHKPQPIEPAEPLRALVRGAMSYDVADGKAEDAMKAIEKEFVDLNELRVATDLEIQELLGVRYPDIERRVAMITQALNNIFEREHTLNLERLKTVSRRDARQFLRELPEIHPFVEAYVMLYAFGGHAFPIDEEILMYLKDEDVVDAEASLDDAQKFIEHNLKAEEIQPFYTAIRAAVFEESRRKKKAKA
jgi:endonuclease III